MNLYEHTIVARQDVTDTQIDQLTEKYSKIIQKYDGNIVKTENWGFKLIVYNKKIKKGNLYTLNLRGMERLLHELEKNEKIDKN